MPDDYYSPSIHVTEMDGIGMNLGGTVIVLPIEIWFQLAKEYVNTRFEPVEYPSSPRQPSADERAEFEKWAKGKNLPTMPNGDVYVHVESQMAWEAWQARAKLRDVSPARGGGE